MGAIVRERSALRAIIAIAVALVITGLCASEARAQAKMVAIVNGGAQATMPLVEEHARVDIDEQHATTVLTYVFENTTGMRVEGSFSFRAGEGANVDGFSYWNGKEKIVGEVMEKNVARRIYQSTVSRRRDPGLLEKTGEGAFAFRVFPIEPGERKRIEIRLNQWLPRRDRSVVYKLALSRQGAETELTIRDDRTIRRVTSATHALRVQGAGTKEARVLVGASANRDPFAPGAGRDLALHYELDDRVWKVHAHAHQNWDKAGYFVMTLAAPPVDDALSQDLTIVLDASTTMIGEPLRDARLITARLIKSLRGSDRLNLIVLGGKPQRLYPTPRWVTKATRDEALALLLDASPGGAADLGKGLEVALTSQEKTGRNKTILLMSDGRSGVANAIATGSIDAASARVFTFGFGPNVDRAALTRIAEARQGRFMLVDSADKLVTNADRLSQWIAAPVLRKITLSTDGGVVRDLYPSVMPDLYAGQELRVVGRIEGAQPTKLTLRGQGDKSYTFTASLDPSKEPRRGWIGKLWARDRVEHLLAENAAAQSPQRTSEIIELALAYNIVTPFTAFLAIPESEIAPWNEGDLAAARKQKQEALQKHKDASAIAEAEGRDAPANEAPRGALAQSPAMDMPPPMAAPKAWGDRRSEDEGGSAENVKVHGRGCAGCEVGASGSPKAGLLAAVSLLIVGLARRRRRRS